MSRADNGNQCSIYQSAANAIHSNQDGAVKLPPPDETWTRSEAPPELQDVLETFRRKDVVQAVGWRDRQRDRREYRTHPKAYEQADRYDRELPGDCNHRGVRNPRDGPYTCRRDDCDVELTREEAIARIQRGGA